MVIEGMSVFPVSQGIPQGTIASPMVSSYIMYMEGVLMFRMFLQVSLKVSLFPQWYLKVSHVHRRHLKVYVTVVAEGIIQGISQGCSQGATQSLGNDIFDPGLRDQEVDVPQVDALVARRVRVGGSSHGDHYGIPRLVRCEPQVGVYPTICLKRNVKVDTIVFSTLFRYLMYIEGISML